MVKVKKQRNSRLVQGDLLRNVEHIERVNIRGGIVEVSKIIYPLVVVLTQDCDLSQDYMFRWSRANTKNHDKYLLSVLAAPLYNVEHVYTGEHLQELNMVMSPINKNKTPGDSLRRNETPRYHYLEFPNDVQIVSSVIDFKHYFSIDVRYLKDHKKNNFVCQLSELFREDVSQRFSNYLARIGLP